MRNPESKIPGLTFDILRQLYETELLSETQIAERFGCNQVYIGRLRTAMGIPALSKGDRLARTLPALTTEQEQVLIGSLLGDGSLSATSVQSARYTESHSVKQEAYLRWKAEMFSSYLAAIIPTEKRDSKSGKVFQGWSFTTRACPQLRPFYDQFYPEPNRKRIFPADLPQRMTPLVLAVWYMDDGGVSVTGEPRIAFGLDDLSLARSRQALFVLGLDTAIYGTGTNREILFPKCGHIVRDLISPFLHPSLAYKMPRDTPRRAGDRNARRLSPEMARILYDQGHSIVSIAKTYQVGTSTVSRRLQLAGTSKRRSGPWSGPVLP